MGDSIERLSYELSANALAEQERALAGLRGRAATVLGTASVCGSLASSRAMHGGLELPVALAMLAFVLALLSSLWVLLPHELAFAARGGDIFDATKPVDGTDLGEVYRDTAAWIDECVLANQTTLRQLALWLTVSCLLLSVEIVLFGIGVVR